MENKPTTTMACRFYENEYPNEDDLVMGLVTNVEENACYVDLLEYQGYPKGKSGMITPNQYTRSMQKSVKRALKINSEEVVRVIRVDKEKGYIDLSKKKVHPNEELETAERFAVRKTIHSIMRTIAEAVKQDLETIYRKITWPLDKEGKNPLEEFKQALFDENRFNHLQLDANIQEKLFSEIRRRFQPPKVKIMAVFDLSTNDFEGINLIKETLNLGQSKSRKDFDIEITILGAPAYLISVETNNKTEGISLINQALGEMQKFIESRQGMFKVKEEAKVVGDKNAHLYMPKIDEPRQAQSDSDVGSDMGDASSDEDK